MPNNTMTGVKFAISASKSLLILTLVMFAKACSDLLNVSQKTPDGNCNPVNKARSN